MVTDTERLRLGRIAYLNVWPLYESLIPAFPAGPDLDYVSGHPSQLNTALISGAIADRARRGDRGRCCAELERCIRRRELCARGAQFRRVDSHPFG